MKKSKFNRFVLLALAALGTNSAFALNLWWDGNASTANSASDNSSTAATNWLSDGNWDSTSASAPLASWTAGNSAIFGGSATSQTITAGTLSVGSMTFGQGAQGAGTSGTAYTIIGGTITLNGNITANTDTTISSDLSITGLHKNGLGTLTLNGTITGGGLCFIDAGTLQINGGSLATSGTFRFADPINSVATYTQTAGTVTTSNNGLFFIGNQTGASATANFSGGSFTKTLSTTYLGNQCTGIMNVSGTATVNLLGLNFGTGGNSTLNLNGGTLALTTITHDNAAKTCSINFNGGTLKAAAASATFIANAAGTSAKVKSGGAVINDGGFAITIGQPLLHDSALGGTLDGGLTKSGVGTLTLANANTYTGATNVNQGTLTLGATGSINNSTGIRLSAGAAFDVSALPSPYVLPGATPLSASGTGTTAGTNAAVITGAASGEVDISSVPVTLTWAGAASGTDTAHPPLTVSQGTLNLGTNKQFTVVTSTALTDGVYTLISAPAITGTVNTAALYTGGSGLVAGKAGTISISGNSVILTVAPITASITISGTPGPVTTTYGTASNTTSFSVFGSNLTAGITVQPPAGYEVSTTIGSGYSGSGIIVGNAPTVTSATVYVRLAANTPVVGNYSGQNIMLSTPGAALVNVPTAATGNSVTAKFLTLSSVLTQSKPYDGTTATSVTGTLQAEEDIGTGTPGDGRPYVGDALTVTCSGSTFNNAGPGTSIGVTAGTFILGGSAVANYTLTQPTGLSLSANIASAAVWAVDSNGLWSDDQNWVNGIIPNASGVAVDFYSFHQSGATIITLDSNRTAGSITFGNDEPIDWTLGTVNGSILTLAGPTTPAITVQPDITTTISVKLDGTQGLTKDGAGTLKLSGTNTYAGTTAVNNGKLITSGAAQPATVSVGQDGTYHPQSVNANVAVSGTGKWELTTDLGSSWTTNGDMSAFTGTTTIGSGFRYWPTVAANIPGGTIRVAAGGQFGLASSQSITGIYHIAGNSWAGHEIDGAIRLNSANLSGGSVAGAVVLDADAGIAAGASGGAGSISASISGPHQLTLMNGTITVSGTNSFDSLNLPAGATAVAGSTTAFGGGGLNVAGTAKLNGNNLSAANMTGSGAFQNGHVTSPASLTVGSDSSSTSFTGVMSNGGTGALGLAKTGDGTLTLANSNTYTGPTAVNNGTLQITGTLSDTTVTVAPAATLDAGSNIGGMATLGSSVSIASGAHLAFHIATTPATQVTRTITGTLTLTAGNLVDLFAITPPADGTYTLATAASIVGTPGTGASLTLGSGSTATLSVNNGNSLVLTVASGGYDSWANQITNGKNLRTQDADDDGFTNLQEFIFGTDPMASNGALTTTQKSGGTLIIRWNERASGATYRLLESATLSNPWVQSGTAVSADGGQTGDYIPRKATVTIGSGKDFFRVEGVEN